MTKRETKARKELITIMFLLTSALFVMAGCGKPSDGKDGSNGSPGESCTIERIANGAEIKCGGDTTAIILDGQDGKDAQDMFVVVNVYLNCYELSTGDHVKKEKQNGKQYFVKDVACE